MKPTEHSEKAGGLARYNAMRDFGSTEEPAGRVRPSESGRAFVIQKHAATALHYDFRLELDGVLLSWAVPKGPSLSPKDKRLAVQTEDHPVDYRDFEGTIPHGEYGGGPVIVWDRGTWEAVGDPREGMKKGRLEFVLRGEKLHGKYILVRLKARAGTKTNWLLIKRDDQFAREGAEAAIVERMPKSVLTSRTIEQVLRGVPADAFAKERAASGGTRKTMRAARTTTKRKTAKLGTAPRGATKKGVEKHAAATHAAPDRKAASRSPRAGSRFRSRVSSTPTRTPRGKRVPAFGTLSPQLASLVDDIPTTGDWLYELKYDGYRALATLEKGNVRIASRSGKDWTDTFDAIAEALSHVRARTAVFDGEVAYVEDDGRTDFQKLQNALSTGRRERLVYFVFDLLHYDGVDLTDMPLEARKDKLRTILAGEGLPLKMGDHLRGDGRALFDHACKMGLEGIIAKRADKAYRPGRGTDWVKVKCQKRQELVIVGYTSPKGTRSGLGALLLGVRDGASYRYVGKVGTGFTQASLTDLSKRLRKLEVDAPQAVGMPRMREAHWVEPKLVCQIRFSEWTRDGALRHPSFEGLREDKNAEGVVREREIAMAEVTPESPRSTKRGEKKSWRAANKSTKTKRKGGDERSAETTRRNASADESTARRDDGEVRLGSIVISHPERIVDPSSGTTKADLARYAEVMADYFLPFAEKRPLMLVRCTDAWSKGGFGSAGSRPKQAACFVQKHAGRGLVTNVRQAEIEGEEVLFVTEPDELFGLVQLNTVELHGWGARLPRIEQPDWIVFDLDPDSALPFARVADAALHLRDALETMGLASFVKTTGGKGLHVVVPLAPKDDWSVVRAFAMEVAHAMVEQAPRDYVATMTKAARKGKIFIDHFRNARGATAILPYSPRAREGATVAMPVAWKDLAKIDPHEFTVHTVPGILAKRRVDPWAELLETSQNAQTLPRELVRALSRK